MKKNKIAVIGLSGFSFFIKTKQFPKVGETVLAEKYHIEYGGKGFNACIAAKRLAPDIEVSFLTAFGSDFIKDEAISLLNKEGIDVHPIIKNNQVSGAAVIEIDQAGDNKVICEPGASNLLNVDDVRSFEKEIKDSKYLLLQLEISDEALVEAINLAKKYDTLIILNPAPAKELDKHILDKCYLITPNEDEYDIVFKNINNLNDYKIIRTLGEKGISLNINGKIDMIDALKVDVVNTTGAGDTFNGALVAYLTKGFNLMDAARYATIASSISVTKEFVIDSIPYKDEIDILLDKRVK